MKKPISLRTVPPGGKWSVTLDNGVVIEQPHPSAFLHKVFVALEANGLFTGEGWSDIIWDKVCQQNPNIPCVEEGHKEIATGWNDIRRFFITLSDLIGSGKPLVSEEVQAKRIQTCLACPLLVSAGACSGCSWVAQKLSELAGNRFIKDEPSVHRKACSACGCEASVKTAYPLSVLREVDKRLELRQPYDFKCWMLNEE